MITLAHPLIALLVLPWLLLCALLWRWQATALAWIESHVAPRFRPALTATSWRGLTVHTVLIGLCGLALIAAAAGPRHLGEAVTHVQRGRILFLLDGSASMAATDAAVLAGSVEPPQNRFAASQRIASELVAQLDGYRFALAIFSGHSTLQLPMTADRSLVTESLRVAELHNHYRNTGSSFTAALDSALHFLTTPTAGDPEAGLQIVLLSDGEMPFGEDFSEPLAALVEADVPIHGVAIGSNEGQARLIYDFRDVVAKKKKKRVLQKFTTRRVERHLRRMARESGGHFALGEGAVVRELAREIERRQAGMVTLPSPNGAKSYRDLSLWSLGLFLLGFWLHRLWLPRRRRGTFEVDWNWLGESEKHRSPSRRGTGTALIVAGALLGGSLINCTGSLDDRARRENELGIASDATGDQAAARRHYERSILYRVSPEVPIHNLARSVALSGDFTGAHRLFQRAIRLAPELIEAHYGDGIVLYEWGEAQRDPRGCELDRTLELFQAAERRWQHAAEVGPATPLQANARLNHEFVVARIDEIKALIAAPPAECTPPQQGGSGSGTGGGGKGGAGKGGGGSSAGGQDLSDSVPPDTTSSTTTGPLTDGEREQINQALARIEQQRLTEGKYHRRTIPEQFSKKSWQNPEAKIWW